MYCLRSAWIFFLDCKIEKGGGAYCYVEESLENSVEYNCLRSSAFSKGSFAMVQTFRQFRVVHRACGGQEEVKVSKKRP